MTNEVPKALVAQQPAHARKGGCLDAQNERRRPARGLPRVHLKREVDLEEQRRGNNWLQVSGHPTIRPDRSDGGENETAWRRVERASKRAARMLLHARTICSSGVTMACDVCCSSLNSKPTPSQCP